MEWRQSTKSRHKRLPFLVNYRPHVPRSIPSQPLSFTRSLFLCHPLPCRLVQICGKFVPANTPILLSTFMAQVLTDPHLQLSSLSRADFEALEAQWASVNTAMVQHEFKPDRWLQREGKGGDMQKPSGLLTFRCGATWGATHPSDDKKYEVYSRKVPRGCYDRVQGRHDYSVQMGPAQAQWAWSCQCCCGRISR